MFLKLKGSIELPYDGITRTGSKGVSHFAEKNRQRPLASRATYWKRWGKATLTLAYKWIQAAKLCPPRTQAGEGNGYGKFPLVT
jgi:hypothetical protein